MSTILGYTELTNLTGDERFLFAKPDGDPANTISSVNLAAYILSLNSYITSGTNVGSGGIGVYAGVSGSLLRFRNIVAGSNKLSVSLSTNNIVVDVAPSNIALSSLGGNLDLTSQVSGSLSLANGGTGGTDGPTARAGIGAASAGVNTDITSVLLNQSGLQVKCSNSNYLVIKPNESLTASRTFNLIMVDANRTLTMTGDASLSGVNTGDQTITLTGDISGTGTSSFVTTIEPNVVDNSKLAQMNSQYFLGRNTASVGDVEYLDQVTAKSILGLEINSTRDYTPITLAFNTPRTPSSTQDTFVIVNCQIVAGASDTGTFEAQVDTGSGYVTIETVTQEVDSVATGSETYVIPMSFIIPANCPYKIIQSGTATNTILSINELSL